MTCKLLVLLTIVSCAFSCERFTFEEGFDELFSTDFGLCSSIPGTWAIGTFESLNMKGFHERSTQFIYPDHLISCVSSPTFDMVPGGIIEVNTFMANSGFHNIIQVIVLDEFNADAGTGIQLGSDFPGAWGSIRITIIGNSPFRGRISILGMASEESIVLVDSFRYLPPVISERDCLLYETDDDDRDNITTNGTTIDTIDVTVDYTTGLTTTETTDNNTYETTNVTNCDTSTDDINKNTDGTTFSVIEDVTDATTENITNDGTTINGVTDDNIDHTTHDIIDHTTNDTFDHTIDYSTLYTTNDSSYDTTSTGGTTYAFTDGATDSTDVIPTETTIENKSGEDISPSPTTRPNVTCDDRKDSLIVRLKMAISVAVNVSAEVVAPLVRIIN